MAERGRLPSLGIGPVGGKRACFGFAAQQRHGIPEVAVQHGVMFDHRHHAGIAHQRGAERTEPITVTAASLRQL
jgi:hypothetical protein